MEAFNASNKDMPEGLSDAQKKYVESLRQTAEHHEQRSKRFETEWSNLFDQNKTLREENHRLQHDYEYLRIQKGGFGFKMLLFSGIGGFVTALLLCFVYLKLRPPHPHDTELAHFRRARLFEYELALKKKQFDMVKSSLEKDIQNTDYQHIKQDLIIIRELIESAE